MIITVKFLIFSYCIAENDDFHDVYRELVCLKARYHQLGIFLGLPASELDAIGSSVHDADQALTATLLTWLRQLYDVNKFGSPTWRRLVEAIEKVDPALAKTVASNHDIVTGLFGTYI